MSITVQTTQETEIRDITDEVNSAVDDSPTDGICLVFVQHTTAGLMVNEAEPRLLSDMKAILKQLISSDGQFAHDEIDDNAAAHLRSMLLSESVSVPIADNTLLLGTWQSILLIESDGPRQRTVQVMSVGK